MLKGIPQHLSADILHALMLMGHGDDLVICGCGIPEAAGAILSLMPLDSFVPAPVWRMEVVGNTDGVVPVFAAMQAVLDRSQGQPVRMDRLERFAFYEAAKRAFCIIRTSDPGPYGCFILRKGVV